MVMLICNHKRQADLHPSMTTDILDGDIYMQPQEADLCPSLTTDIDGDTDMQQQDTDLHPSFLMVTLICNHKR